MRIGSHKLVYGVVTPMTVRKYINARVEALGKTTQRRIGSNFEVRFYPSATSESSYLRIRLRDSDLRYTVSFRNHGHFTQQPFDRQILLGRYENWLDCKRDFLENILPEVIEELTTTRWAERSITLPIIAEMTRALRETGATK